MKRRTILFRSLVALAIPSAGCLDDASNCHITKDCAPDGGAGGAGGGSGSGGGGMGGTIGSCDPSAPDFVPGPSCGVFVSPGGDDDSGDGTAAAPYASFAKAFASGTVIYACQGTYPGSIDVPDGVEIKGGLACSTYAANPGGRSTIDGAAVSPAVTIGGSAIVAGLEVQSKFFAGVWVLPGAVATIDDSDIAISAGAPGAAIAAVPTDPLLDGASGGMGGTSACNGGSASGGSAGAKICAGTNVSGGFGGAGDADNNGFPGGNGSPFNAGAGQGGVAAVNASPCMPGGIGAPGMLGATGNGVSGAGMLDALGFHPATSAAVGGAGIYGQGGGGGGGGRDCVMSMQLGPGGGGGGSGGCGGLTGGVAGNAGTSVFAIAVVDATVTLTNVTLTASNGGLGGTGQKGQAGGAGGMPGPAGFTGACAGAAGGKGGDAGGGGGGVGGHSMGIAFVGTAPVQTNVVINVGLPGDGGDSGDGAIPAKKGGAGVACRLYDFAALSCLTP